jgi:ADP-heptose:LPS heptosyltransferase
MDLAMTLFNSNKTKYLKAVDAVLKFFYKAPNSNVGALIEKTQVQNILVISFLLLGDSIMYLPPLRVLRKNFPNASITLVGGTLVKKLYSNQGVFDQFIEAESFWVAKTRNPLKILKFFLTLRVVNKLQYDMAIDFRGDWRNIFYMSHINADRKISYNYTGGEYMLTDAVDGASYSGSYVGSYLYLLKELGCDMAADDAYPTLEVTDTQKKLVSSLIDKKHLNEKLIVGVHPGASLEIKQLDVEVYADAIVSIREQHSQTHFFIFQGPNESEIVTSLCAILPETIEYTIIASPLSEYIAYVSGCSLLICNDSGASHIAASLNVPVVVVYTNVEPRYFSPNGRNVVRIISHSLPCKPCTRTVCPLGTDACKKAIQSSEVSLAANELVESLLRKGSPNLPQ